jgi:REP element-mobilizing transposase RayT
VTRRCSERRCFLRPSEPTSRIILYVLALAARRFNVAIHAFCVLSNHIHLVVTDRDGNLPAFQQYLAALVARAVNASLGRWESFWAPSTYSAVVLATPDDVVSKTAYVLANPVAAGLVRHGSEWPGLRTAPEKLGHRVVLAAPKPTMFFRSAGYLPDVAELELTAPPGLGSEEFGCRVRDEVSEREERARRDAAARGAGFLGTRRVLAQRPWARPRTVEPRRGLAPRVAARDPWKRAEALGRVREFLRAYEEARVAFARGAREAVFPAGTYLLRVALGVRCAVAG